MLGATQVVGQRKLKSDAGIERLLKNESIENFMRAFRLSPCS